MVNQGTLDRDDLGSVRSRVVNAIGADHSGHDVGISDAVVSAKPLHTFRRHGLAAALAVMALGVILPAQAQLLPPVYGPRPYDDVQDIYEPPVVVGPRVIMGSPYGRPRYEEAVLPPQEVFAILRSTGFSPLGAPARRGRFYVIAAIHPNGEDGRAMIDAVTGRFVRFVPAYAVERNPRGDEGVVAYGRPGYGPPPLPDARRLPRPPAGAPAPKVASRSSPAAPLAAPKPRPAAAPHAVTAQSPPVQAQPQTPATSPAPAAATPPETAPAAVAATPAPETKPAEAVGQQPVPAMPPVQPLD